MLAKVYAVSFLNLWHAKGKVFAIWCVRVGRVDEEPQDPDNPPTTTRDAEASTLCFVLHELTAADRNAQPCEPPSAPTAPTKETKEFMRWEMALRAKHPFMLLLTQHCGNLSSVFNLELNGAVILQAELSASGTGQQLRFQAHPRFAYMWCNGRASAADPDSLETLEVTIKTKLGMYFYSTQHEDALPEVKRPRHENALNILDVFVPRDYTLQVAGTVAAVRVAVGPFDCLVINDDCRWNTALFAFFGALYNKLYRGFYGLKALLLYAEPSDRTFPLCPYFSSFPNAALAFAGSFKTFPKVLSPLGPAALLQESLSDKVNNVILECITGTHTPPVPREHRHGIGICWPPGATEINSKLLGEEHSCAYLNYPHELYIIHFTFVTTHTHLALPEADILRLLTKYSMGTLRQSINTWYNLLVYSVMNFCNLHNLQWIAFNQSSFYLASGAGAESPPMLNILQDYLTTTFSGAFRFKVSHGRCQRTLAMGFHSTLLLSSDNQQLFGKESVRPSGWVGVLTYFMHLLCSDLAHSVIFQELVNVLFTNTADSNHWVLPLAFVHRAVEKPQASKLQTSVKIITADGESKPWLPDWGLPSTLSYSAYISHLQEISHIWKEIEPETAGAESMENYVDDLLRLFF
nr:ORF40 helicase-primase subunit C [Ovine gammaherpesvirus 2]